MADSQQEENLATWFPLSIIQQQVGLLGSQHWPTDSEAKVNLAFLPPDASSNLVIRPAHKESNAKSGVDLEQNAG